MSFSGKEKNLTQIEHDLLAVKWKTENKNMKYFVDGSEQHI